MVTQEYHNYTTKHNILKGNLSLLHIFFPNSIWNFEHVCHPWACHMDPHTPPAQWVRDLKGRAAIYLRRVPNNIIAASIRCLSSRYGSRAFAEINQNSELVWTSSSGPQDTRKPSWRHKQDFSQLFLPVQTVPRLVQVRWDGNDADCPPDTEEPIFRDA